MSRNYLEALIVIIAAAALGFFLAWPKYVNLREVVQKLEVKQAEIKNRQEYFASLEKTAADLEQHQAALEKVETALPNGVDAPAVMNFIQLTAMQSGMILKHIDYAKISGVAAEGPAAAASAETKRTVQTYEIASTLVGTYAGLKDFLSRIELSSRVIETGEINFNYDIIKNKEEKNANPAKKNSEPTYEFKVNFYAHYY